MFGIRLSCSTCPIIIVWSAQPRSQTKPKTRQLMAYQAVVEGSMARGRSIVLNVVELFFRNFKNALVHYILVRPA